MFEINLYLCLFLTLNYIHYGASVNYNPYDDKQTHLLQATNSESADYNTQQPASVYQQNLQPNSNYQQFYRYYCPPPYQRQPQQLQSQQSTKLWSGSPIVVEDGIQQQQPPSTNIPTTFYQQHPSSSINKSNEFLPLLHRNSDVLPPTAYNPQPTARTTQFNYNNNNNIVYHRDFRHRIDATPESQRTQADIVSWNNQQQQQRSQQQEQPQQFYSTNTNLRYNGISNDFQKKDNLPDYREHFRRYLQNNPRRIKPIY